MRYTAENPLKFTVLGTPQPKQSARFRIVKGKDKTFISSYQSKKVVDNEMNFAWDVKSQLPKDFVPFDVPIAIKATFVFAPLKSWNKALSMRLESGEKIYKSAKPDLTDNLMKGTADSMSGIVYIDDSRICKVESEKIFGLVPRIELEFYEL